MIYKIYTDKITNDLCQKIEFGSIGVPKIENSKIKIMKNSEGFERTIYELSFNPYKTIKEVRNQISRVFSYACYQQGKDDSPLTEHWFFLYLYKNKTMLRNDIHDQIIVTWNGA